jgi:hypothetical protein
MVKVYYYLDEKLLDVDIHGAFTSYRNASEWIINEGFEVYFDDDASELFKDETIGFYYTDDMCEQYAIIETFTVFGDE